MFWTFYETLEKNIFQMPVSQPKQDPKFLSMVLDMINILLIDQIMIRPVLSGKNTKILLTVTKKIKTIPSKLNMLKMYFKLVVLKWSGWGYVLRGWKGGLSSRTYKSFLVCFGGFFPFLLGSWIFRIFWQKILFKIKMKAFLMNFLRKILFLTQKKRIYYNTLFKSYDENRKDRIRNDLMRKSKNLNL